MQTTQVRDDLELMARHLRFGAETVAPWSGEGLPRGPRVVHIDTKTGLMTAALYSRDTGHHTSGWFKNPDYERCYHLSLSFNPPGHEDVKRTAATLCRYVFGDNLRYAWQESAKSEGGKALGVVHWRVFCDHLWQPLLPRGEVYTREFTEKGWRTWSEVHGGVTPGMEDQLGHENPDK